MDVRFLFQWRGRLARGALFTCIKNDFRYKVNMFCRKFVLPRDRIIQIRWIAQEIDTNSTDIDKYIVDIFENFRILWSIFAGKSPFPMERTALRSAEKRPATGRFLIYFR